ncbi:Fructosamine kinase-domain-containing protein [Clohesyomyces aquaticus]|uniref:protein-ribulosamine 3-kinase n=1 Tax=Clohesyomyces aquaticus TaxID=1231657 RepID=A0A1Y1YIC1_9PLEO|nr:Fructosamine kinase-domain-containing protein [Clohesyomyces aquaticus]
MNYMGAPGLEFGGGNIEVDPTVAKALPEGSRVISAKGHGVSFRAKTGRIDVELSDGTQKSFFTKVESQYIGKDMLSTYKTLSDTYFFLTEFRDMLPNMYDPDKFAARLSTLLQNSKSPNGKYGFHVTTYASNLPQYTQWEESWEIFFAKSLRQALDLEIKAKGQDPDFDVLVLAIFGKVISHLLRPLESEGCYVKPFLVQGDFWSANSGVLSDSGEPLVFDACCFYGHNEYEFGQWLPVCNRFGAEYVDAYHTYVQISAPEEDFDCRLDLYKLRFNTHVSALFHDNPTLREQYVLCYHIS